MDCKRLVCRIVAMDLEEDLTPTVLDRADRARSQLLSPYKITSFKYKI